MIFKDKIREKRAPIEHEINNLFEIALKNQTHSGDLLLLFANGFFSDDINEGNKTNPNKFSPYVIGMGKEGWSEHTHFDFIDVYRRHSISKETYVEYIKKHQWDPTRQKEIEELTNDEGITIHVEMMIYLKIWEADLTIKKLYEFVRILNGEHYDWHFKISESNRDRSATGTRQDLIRNSIRDKIAPFSKQLNLILRETYLTQLRNSIAHSNYSFLGRHIHPNNYIETDPASQLKAISFDQWIDIFHNTIMLQNELIGLSNRIWKHYSDLALANSNLSEIRITKADGSTELKNLFYRAEYKEWVWESQMTS
jgi:hypothetical protein